MGFDCEVRLKYGTVASVQMRASSHNLPMISASCLEIRAQRVANSYFQLWDGSASGIGKNFGFGSGIFAKKMNNRVLEILIGYFWVHPNIVQFLYERLIHVTDFSHF